MTTDEANNPVSQVNDYQALMLEAQLAFHGALGAVEDIAKTQVADTGKYTYKFAGLPEVLEEVKRACQMFGLAITQTPTANEGMLEVCTKLIHKNGGEVNFDPIRLPLPKEAQPFGSALTYLRRYSLLTIFAIATEDDDGKAATVAAQTQPGRRTEAERLIRESMATMDDKMRSAFAETFKGQFGSNLTDLPASRHGDALTFTREWVKGYQVDEPKVAAPDSGEGMADADAKLLEGDKEQTIGSSG